MKIIALEKEIKPNQSDESHPYLLDEAAKVYEFYLSGIIREFYFHETDHTAVLILECSDVNQAQKSTQQPSARKSGIDHL